MKHRLHNLHQISHKKYPIFGGNPQSVQHLSCVVLQLAEIVLLGGY